MIIKGFEIKAILYMGSVPFFPDGEFALGHVGMLFLQWPKKEGWISKLHFLHSG